MSENRHPGWSFATLLLFGGGFSILAAYGLDSPELSVNTLAVVPYAIGAVLLGIVIAFVMTYYEATKELDDERHH